MLGFIYENLATIVICILLIGIVSAIVTKLVKDKKKGKSPCGCNCGSCAMSGSCHNHAK